MSEIFYPSDVTFTADGKKHDASIQLKGLNGLPDCQIGNFGENWYIRTPMGMKSREYKNESAMRSAVIKVLKNNGASDIHFIARV